MKNSPVVNKLIRAGQKRKEERKMKTTKAWRVYPYLIVAASAGSLFGCANYEVNTRRGDIPGYYIRTEMQEADRAVESARQAGKDKTCPV